MALRVPGPVRFDAYCLLKGLANIEPTVNSSGLPPWTACQAFNDASAFGLSAVSSHGCCKHKLLACVINEWKYGASKVVTPVITYLESVYSAQSSSTVPTGNHNLSNNPKALKAVHSILSSSIKWL